MSIFIKQALGPWTVGAALLAGLVPAAWAQSGAASAAVTEHAHGSPPAVDPKASAAGRSVRSGLIWQDANRAVGQFRRGHVDLLQWEQKNLPALPGSPTPPDAGKLTLEKAVRLALQDEGKWLKPGMSALEQATLQQQLMTVRLDVHRLWVHAVAARQSVAHSQSILAVAQAGAELGHRMTQVGNWSRARQIEEELTLWDARARADKAQLQADRALHALWQRIGATLTAQALAQQLPAHLPEDLPASWPVNAPDRFSPEDVLVLQSRALQSHLRWPLEDLQARRLMAGLGLSDQELQSAQKALSDLAGQERPVWDPRTMRWGHAFENAWQARLQANRLARQVQADVQLAVNAFLGAREAAQQTRVQVLRLHTERSEQTLLRYNGMLKSTWDLLASARERMDSVDAALQAQRQLWLAHTDLMAVLAGLPYADSTGMSDSEGPSSHRKPGH
ncbi:MAG: hypothetical protein ACKODC_09435 [Limnohabitans sp.]